MCLGACVFRNGGDGYCLRFRGACTVFSLQAVAANASPSSAQPPDCKLSNGARRRALGTKSMIARLPSVTTRIAGSQEFARWKVRQRGKSGGALHQYQQDLPQDQKVDTPLNKSRG